MSEPLVSVIIGNYNYAEFLPIAIDSVLQQTYGNVELIVVDDGSTDDSRALIADYKEQITPVLQQNGGQAAALNAGFTASKGGIICFLDADDIFEADKVQKIVDIFHNRDDAGWCFHALKLFSHQTSEPLCVTRAFPNRRHDPSGDYDFRWALRQGHLGFYAPSTSGLCFTRSLLVKILPMPEALRMAADRYLTNAAVFLSQGYFLQTPLTHQRIHSSNDGTLQENLSAKQKLGYNAILTAYFLHANFPETWKFSHRTFAIGWGTARRYGFVSDEAKRTQQRYLSSVSWWEKSAILLISWYHNRPWKKVSFYR